MDSDLLFRMGVGTKTVITRGDHQSSASEATLGSVGGHGLEDGHEDASVLLLGLEPQSGRQGQLVSIAFLESFLGLAILFTPAQLGLPGGGREEELLGLVPLPDGGAQQGQVGLRRVTGKTP